VCGRGGERSVEEGDSVIINNEGMDDQSIGAERGRDWGSVQEEELFGVGDGHLQGDWEGMGAVREIFLLDGCF